MGTLRRSILIACALAVTPLADAWGGGGFRFPPEPVVPVPAPIAIPEYSAWYLRGDIAWGHHDDPDISQAGVGLSGSEMDQTWGFGAGFGYHFTDKIRGDLTVDYRLDADVTGVHPGTGTHDTDVSSTVALANVYYDIRGRDQFTPYLGAGIGFSYNETDDQTVKLNGVQTGRTGGHGSTEFAFAAMAGLSYRMNDRWLLDAGYRFLYLGDAETEGTAAVDEMKITDIQAHEFRFGVRYEFQ